MGSGALLAALVVLWFVVLVPMVVTRGDARADAVADSGRTLKRRRPVDPVVHAETERVSVDRAALRASGERRVDVHAVRRRILAGLLGAAVLTLVSAVAWHSFLWAPQVVLDLGIVAFLMTTRAAAQRERRAAARRQVREALRPPVRTAAERPAEHPAVRSDVRADAPVERSTAEAQHPSMPLAQVRPLRPGRVIAARTPTPAGWQHSAVVGLDDDDIGFADVDVYQPKRVVNG